MSSRTHYRRMRGPYPSGISTSDFGWRAAVDVRLAEPWSVPTRYVGRLVDAKGYGFTLVAERAYVLSELWKGSGWRWEVRRATPDKPHGGIVSKSNPGDYRREEATEVQAKEAAQDSARYWLQESQRHRTRMYAARSLKSDRKAQKEARRRNR